MLLLEFPELLTFPVTDSLCLDRPKRSVDQFSEPLRTGIDLRPQPMSRLPGRAPLLPKGDLVDKVPGFVPKFSRPAMLADLANNNPA